MSRLKDKVAIVTGASSGIGRATAELFAREGAKVVVAARREHELATLVGKIRTDGGEAISLAGDVQSEDFAKSLADLAVDSFGHLDVAFNNAGTLGERGPSTNVSKEGWEQTISTNLTSAFLCAKHQVPQMLKTGGGSIIFTSTFVGYSFAFPGVAAYATSKSGLIGLTQALAAEFGPQGLRVNAILPGAIETPMYYASFETPEQLESLANLHALKRVGQPEEVARTALFLASEDSSFVSGIALLIDGGASVTRA